MLSLLVNDYNTDERHGGIRHSVLIPINNILSTSCFTYQGCSCLYIGTDRRHIEKDGSTAFPSALCIMKFRSFLFSHR